MYDRCHDVTCLLATTRRILTRLQGTTGSHEPPVLVECSVGNGFREFLGNLGDSRKHGMGCKADARLNFICILRFWKRP